MTERYILVGLSGPQPGRDDDYNTWYTEKHVRDALKVIGTAERGKLDRTQGGVEPPFPYIAVYEVETDDLDATLAELEKACAEGAGFSDAIDVESVVFWAFKSITGRLVAH